MDRKFLFEDWSGDELLVTAPDRRVNGRRILQIGTCDGPGSRVIVDCDETAVAGLIDHLTKWLNDG